MGAPVDRDFVGGTWSEGVFLLKLHILAPLLIESGLFDRR
jgi:hypothetical protein